MGFKATSIETRFWSKVKRAKGKGCWEWTGAKTNGYGMLKVGCRVHQATHVLFYLRHGHWPEKGRTANHHCDNPGCINPQHLYLGTHKSNARDRDHRGRSNYFKGERNGMSKLTDDDVLEIKELLVKGLLTQEDIGKSFGVSQPTISYIKAGIRMPL